MHVIPERLRPCGLFASFGFWHRSWGAVTASDIAVRFGGVAELSAGSQLVLGGAPVRVCDRLRCRTWQPGPTLAAMPASRAALAQPSASIRAVT